MKTRYLLIVTALIEVGAGLTFAIAPAVVVAVMLGSKLESTAGMAVARLAGAALFALGAACWLARNDERSRAARAIIVAMLIYNTAAVALLAYVGIVFGLRGAALWPAVLLHAALAVWCVACLQVRQT